LFARGSASRNRRTASTDRVAAFRFARRGQKQTVVAAMIRRDDVARDLYRDYVRDFSQYLGRACSESSTFFGERATTWLRIRVRIRIVCNRGLFVCVTGASSFRCCEQEQRAILDFAAKAAMSNYAKALKGNSGTETTLSTFRVGDATILRNES